ncbi:MAG: type II toxin-antitoxin system VapC family toxin [Candidatus Acidiferrales bacterium]
MTGTTVSELWLIDSSAWLEYLTQDVDAAKFAPYIESDVPTLVPTIVLYEVVKVLMRERGKMVADRFISEVLRRVVEPLEEGLALAAAHISNETKLAMADAIIYATAQARQAQLVTGNTAFRGLPGVIIP